MIEEPNFCTTAVAKYKYHAKGRDELTVYKNQLVKIIYSKQKKTWIVENQDGIRGKAPATCFTNFKTVPSDRCFDDLI